LGKSPEIANSAADQRASRNGLTLAQILVHKRSWSKVPVSQVKWSIRVRTPLGRRRHLYPVRFALYKWNILNWSRRKDGILSRGAKIRAGKTIFIFQKT
jgi:hypothetical protein